ncbi:uncharacterized protein At5g41620 isoform X2 [Cornus florida]|uniref:uncharacterized protein At5g41620 isoform X2 n=1 Tax=Cornus florida TaxID=4283 RepID=UPI0028A241A4|nr:uncharacterized protein At5g41620 isoform X2 [Cornus florida]
MPRQNLNVEGRMEGECKIRKRGCSSSSSSSLVQNYRLKRAILVGKRGGSSTPVPTWKMSSRTVKNGESMKFAPIKGGDEVSVSVSARKLAATLWEINEVPSPEANGNKMKGVDGTKGDGHRRRRSSIPQLGGLDYNGSIMEVETQPHGRTPSRCIVGVKSRLKDVSNGLTTSKEILKVLNRIWGLEEQHSSSLSLVSALRVELNRARVQVDQLIREQKSSRNEIDYLLKQFAEEKAVWKTKEQDRIHNAIASVAEELKVEKKLRRQTERLNKKLGKELADTKASLSKAVKELESEKRAREILEQVCDELARGIGEDRAEVEDLKRESAKVREEVEKERQMLQLADLLREERVQMKLLEAKYQFEEKNAAVDKLRNELEGWLRTKIGEERDDGSPNFLKGEELEYLRRTLQESCQNGEKEKDEGEVVNGKEHEGSDSADSDLHSIELNMDDNCKSYNWSYAYDAAAQNDSNRTSVDEKIKGRRSISEKIMNSISLERTTSDGIEWEFGAVSKENSDGFDRGRLFELASQAWRKDCDDEIERYKMVKDLRDHILSGSRIASSQCFASPTRN